MAGKSTTTTTMIWPPSSVLGMKTLDREAFKKPIKVPYVSIESAEKFQAMQKKLKQFYLKMPSFRPVVHEENSQFKIYLHPEKVDSKEKLDDVELLYEDYELKYENFDHHDTLRAILPPEIDAISGFSTIGHLIHLNLRDDALPYKSIIGQVLLDKINGCKMVVNKLDNIETKFRYFPMEVIAKDESEPDLTTVVSTSESKLNFRFDFAKVYWNPRLSAERTRICQKMLKDVDVLYDVFAGVGPFALPVAKFNRCRVLANDLNPESYRWLGENITLNKLEDRISAFNLDGREFVLSEVKRDLQDYARKFDGCDANRRYHIVMNLPDIALEFLDVFSGLLASQEEDVSYKIPFVNVHCYCFVKNLTDEPAEEKKHVINEAQRYLGHQIPEEDVDEVYNVRKVAPNKNMYRISFRVGQNILYHKTAVSDPDYSESTKRLKTN